MDKLTIKQAALALGISAQTVRRRIAKGELTANKEVTAVGEMWLIPESAVKAAIHTVEVIPLTRSVTPAEINHIVGSAVAVQVAVQIEPLKEEIQRLRAELAMYFQQQEPQEQKALEVEAAPLPEKKGFFQRLFG